MHSGDSSQPGCNRLLRFATRLQKCQKNPNLTRIWGGDSEEALTEVTQTSQMHNLGTSLYGPNTEMQFKAVLLQYKAGIVGFFYQINIPSFVTKMFLLGRFLLMAQG